MIIFLPAFTYINFAHKHHNVIILHNSVGHSSVLCVCTAGNALCETVGGVASQGVLAAGVGGHRVQLVYGVLDDAISKCG